MGGRGRGRRTDAISAGEIRNPMHESGDQGVRFNELSIGRNHWRLIFDYPRLVDYATRLTVPRAHRVRAGSDRAVRN